MIVFAMSAATGRSYLLVPEFRFGTAVLVLAGLLLYPGAIGFLNYDTYVLGYSGYLLPLLLAAHSRLRDLRAICSRRVGPEPWDTWISAWRRTQPQSLGLRYRSGRLDSGDRIMGRNRGHPSAAQVDCGARDPRLVAALQS